MVVFTKPYIRHAGQGNQFMGFYTMTLGVLMGLAQAANFVTMYMFFEMMSLITVPLVLHNATPRPAGQASNTWGIPYSARAWPWPATSLSPIT